VPKGPIPELELSFLKRTTPEQRGVTTTTTPAPANGSAAAPRD
jgi:hypothetical protein